MGHWWCEGSGIQDRGGIRHCRDKREYFYGESGSKTGEVILWSDRAPRVSWLLNSIFFSENFYLNFFIKTVFSGSTNRQKLLYWIIVYTLLILKYWSQYMLEYSWISTNLFKFNIKSLLWKTTMIFLLGVISYYNMGYTFGDLVRR